LALAFSLAGPVRQLLATNNQGDPPMPDDPLRVLIYGSCVSRDAFELFSEDDGVELVEYVARSSVISSMSKRPFTRVRAHAIKSKFRRRMVIWDLESTKVKELIRRGAFDILLMDFIDERFDLLRRGRETFATCSSEFLEARFIPSSERRIEAFSEDYLKAWRKAWTRFVGLAEGCGKLGSVRLGRVKWADSLPDGTPLPEEAQEPPGCERANSFLEELYSWAAQSLDPEQFYDYPDAELVCDPNHKWGLSHYHYVPAYNEHLVANLIRERADGALRQAG
jgi:hypothetical protein